MKIERRVPFQAATWCFAAFVAYFAATDTLRAEPRLRKVNVLGSAATIVECLNAANTVVGYFVDAAGNEHAFFRPIHGAITAFDVPGASNTVGTSISGRGDIVGGYSIGSAEIWHAYLRASDGTLTLFDAPGGDQGTIAAHVNNGGQVAGEYVDSSRIYIGFLRAADGTITAFQPQGSIGLIVEDMTNAGVVVGYWLDSNYTRHGFVRAADGTITSIDAPGAGSAGTELTGINANGDLTGSHSVGSDPGVDHAFLRDASGQFTDFLADRSPTFPVGINGEGTIVGVYETKQSAFIGFLRYPDGTLTPFSIGNANMYPRCINNGGVVAGYLYKPTRHGAKARGFIGLP